MEDGSRRILIVAGPNGAGKTTFACEYLPQEAGCPIFINADLIAEGLSPFAPELVAIRSGRLMLQMIRDHATRGDSFAFETTLAGRNYARAIPRWQGDGYSVTLFFLSLPRWILPSLVSRNESGREATMFRMTSSVDDILRAVKTSRRSTSPSWMNGSFTTTRGHSRSCSTGEGSDE
jgi:hypothetical protein